MALSPYDQQVYDAGFKFIPQTSYLQNPFIIPQNNVEVGDSSTAGLPSINIGGGGGGDNNPFNPNMNQIRTDFRPNTDFRQFQDFGNLTDAELSTADRKAMDMYPEYYGINTGVPKKGIAGFMDSYLKNSFLGKGLGIVKGIAESILPVNQRAIFENQARGMGVLTDDIGRIVSRPGEYNTPEGVMAGYNLSKVTDKTFDKRTDRIGQTLSEKYNISDADIQGLIDGTLDDDDISAKYGITTNLTSQIRNVELARQNILNAQKKAAEIAAFKEKQRQQEKLERQRARTREADREAGAFSSQVQLDKGGGGTFREQTAAKERQGVQVAGPGFGKGAYFMDGGIVDMLEIYD